MKLLVSLFHTSDLNTLCVFDENFNNIGFFGHKDFNNAKGIALFDNKILVAHKNTEGECFIVIYSKEKFKIIQKISLPETKDIHSILIKDHKLFVVSSGTNEIHVYKLVDILKLNRIYPTERIRPIKDCNVLIDEFHFNSVNNLNEMIIVSAFGKKKNEGDKWVEQNNGFILNVDNNNVLNKESIKHPHSLVVVNEDLFFCESGKNNIFKNNQTIIENIDGYPRGLAILEDKYIFVGSSTRIYDDKKSKNKSKIIRFCLKNNSYIIGNSFIFDDSNLEIYDIICLNY